MNASSDSQVSKKTAKKADRQRIIFVKSAEFTNSNSEQFQLAAFRIIYHLRFNRNVPDGLVTFTLDEIANRKRLVEETPK